MVDETEDELFAELMRVGPDTFAGLAIASKIIALRSHMEKGNG